MDSILTCFPFLRRAAEGNERDLAQANEKTKIYTDDEPAALCFIETFRTSNDMEHLHDELRRIVSATSWTENLAVRILHGIEDIIRNEVETGLVMAEAIKKAKSVALEFAREHPVYAALIAAGTIIAIGVLVMYAPAWVINALGFAAKGPRRGSFAARWMSEIAKRYGGVSSRSIYAYLQRLGMLWKASDLKDTTLDDKTAWCKDNITSEMPGRGYGGEEQLQVEAEFGWANIIVHPCKDENEKTSIEIQLPILTWFLHATRCSVSQVLSSPHYSSAPPTLDHDTIKTTSDVQEQLSDFLFH